jgi:hypothetical protein
METAAVKVLSMYHPIEPAVRVCTEMDDTVAEDKPLAALPRARLNVFTDIYPQPHYAAFLVTNLASRRNFRISEFLAT